MVPTVSDNRNRQRDLAAVTLAGLLVLSAAWAHAATVPSDAIMGQASVIDGDTIEIHGTRIRLHGIDAPESAQLCIVQEREVRCGQQAAFALTDRIGRGAVSCEPRDRDRYGRIVAVCSVRGEDLNAWLVAEGWAMAYREFSPDYIAQEQVASAAKIGIWAGEFVAPWDWRRGERISAEVLQKEGGCAIKGNISAKGERIYHVPGGEFYEKTQISAGKGERWFCSEEEAQAAGWRRSKQ
jgi:endonuclease YncB( thermonuclease family)